MLPAIGSMPCFVPCRQRGHGNGAMTTMDCPCASIRWKDGLRPYRNNEIGRLRAVFSVCWWRRGGSNSRPSHCERDALPAELRPQYSLPFQFARLYPTTAPPSMEETRRFCGARIASATSASRNACVSGPPTSLGSLASARAGLAGRTPDPRIAVATLSPS